ncbi:MAG: hypothetical protein JXQ67_09600 [Campylobacterales bacterium]|nr:hypothetical protein [Campylobacterales bacterium]
MASLNQSMQLKKNCELFVYVLVSLEKDIPEDVLECAMCDDYPINCAKELADTLSSLDKESFDKIMNKENSAEAQDLRNWWEMSQEADRLHKFLSADAE